MADTSKFYRVRPGLSLDDNDTALFAGSIDPRDTSEQAPIGSLYLRTNGEVWYKYGTGDSEWNCSDIGNNSVGTLSVPTFHDNGDGTFNIGSCIARLHSTSDYNSPLKFFTIPAQNNIAVSDQYGSITYYLTIDYNSGNPIYSLLSDISSVNGSSIYTIMRIWRTGNELHSIDKDSQALGLADKTSKMLCRSHPYNIDINGGLIIGEITSPSNRTITVSSAKVYAGNVEIDVLAFNSSIDRLTLVYNGGGHKNFQDDLVYNNTQYDDGTQLQTIGNNKYSKRWYWRSIGDAKQVFYMLGLNQFNSYSEALAAPLRTDVPAILREHCLLIGFSVVQYNANTGVTTSSIQTNQTLYPTINHDDTLNKSGGSPTGGYNHSDQGINKTNSPEWADIRITGKGLLSTALSVGRQVFVDLQKGLATGTGSVDLPFDTIDNAISYINTVDATRTNVWIIQLGAGSFGFTSAMGKNLIIRGLGNSSIITNVVDTSNLGGNGLINLKILVSNADYLVKINHVSNFLDSVEMSTTNYSASKTSINGIIDYQGGIIRNCNIILNTNVIPSTTCRIVAIQFSSNTTMLSTNCNFGGTYITNANVRTYFYAIDSAGIMSVGNFSSNIIPTNRIYKTGSGYVKCANKTPLTFTYAGNPLSTNDDIDTLDIGQGFKKGDVWINTLTNATYRCADATTNNAVWRYESSNQSLNTTDSPEFADVKVTQTGSGREAMSLSNVRTKTKEYTGFFEPENVVIAYDSTARTITLTGTVDAMWRGEKITALTSGWVSPAHDATNGTWFLYYNGTDFIWSNTVWTFDMLQIAFVKYETAYKFGLRECHGFMQSETHKNLHLDLGTKLDSGGDLSGYTLASKTNTNRRPLISQSFLRDEDLQSVLDALLTNSYTRFSLSGVGANVVLDTAQADIVSYTGSFTGGTNEVVYWNQFTGGAWQQTAMTNGQYQKIFVLAVPTTDDAGSKVFRYIFVQGQQVSTVLATIQAVQTSSVQLSTLPNTPEYVFIAEIIIQFQTTGIDGWVITSVSKLSGTRFSQTSTPAGNYLSAVAVDTNNLSGDGTPGNPITPAFGLLSSLGRIGYQSSSNPTANNDGVDTAAIGRIFRIGDEWINTTTDVTYKCVDNTTGAAIWVQTSNTATSSDTIYVDIADARTTGNNEGVADIDGITPIAGVTRILVFNHPVSATRGIWIANAGSWTRATDADTISKILGKRVHIKTGSVYGGLVANNTNRSTDSDTAHGYRIDVNLVQGGTYGLSIFPNGKIQANKFSILHFAAPNRVIGVSRFLYLMRGSGGGDTIPDENKLSGPDNLSGFSFAGNSSPYLVLYGGTIRSIRIAARALAYDGNEQPNTNFTFTLGLYSHKGGTNWNTSSLISNITFTINSGASGSNILGHYDNLDNPVPYTTSRSDLNISIASGEILGLRFISGAGASQNIRDIRQLFVTFCIESTSAG